MARLIHAASPRAADEFVADQRRRHDARAHGPRAVRRGGRGRPPAQDRRVRARPRRHPLPRRGRRHAARDARAASCGCWSSSASAGSAATATCRSTCGWSPPPRATCARRSPPGRFREDLFHRLNVVPVRVPGLAERREDIPELVDYFIDRISEATGLPRRRLADDAHRHPAGAAPGRATCASCATTSSGC